MRKKWDYLGFVRVRSLSKPNWRRDITLLKRLLEAEYGRASDDSSPLLGQAEAALQSYRRVRRRGSETEDAFSERRDSAWDDVLTALDAYLELKQNEHLGAVRAAGASGPSPHADS